MSEEYEAGLHLLSLVQWDIGEIDEELWEALEEGRSPNSFLYRLDDLYFTMLDY